METNATAAAPKASDNPSKLLHDYVTEAEVCAELGIHYRTLRRMPDGPPFVKIANQRRYPIDQFRRWVAKRVRRTA
jgi:hypothetical protein